MKTQRETSFFPFIFYLRGNLRCCGFPGHGSVEIAASLYAAQECSSDVKFSFCFCFLGHKLDISSRVDKYNTDKYME